MVLRRGQAFLQRTLGVIPMQVVLVVPFLLQVFGIVGVVVYLSYYNGQRALEKMAFEVAEEASERISDRLHGQFESIHKLLMLNQYDIEQGHLDGDNLDALGRHFLQQIQLFQSTTVLSFTRPTGEYVSVGQEYSGFIAPKDAYVLSRLDGSAPGTRNYYILNQGTAPAFLRAIHDWDPRQQSGYRRARVSRGQTWTALSPQLDLPITALDATIPTYRNGRFQGVLTAHLRLTHLARFLQQLTVQESWQVFILDRSGHLVAGSTDEPLWTESLESAQASRPQTCAATRDGGAKPSAQTIAAILRSHWPDLSQIQQVEQMQLWSGALCDDRQPPWQGFLSSPRYFLQVQPYSNGHGLDWLVVAVIPVSEFMPEIQESIRHTVIGALLALVGASAFSLCTTRWITRPILSLRNAANQIAHGDYALDIASTPIAEVRQLAFAFRQMAGQLQLSTDEMQALNAELIRNRGQVETFLNAIPVGVVIHAHDDSITYMNQVAQRLLTCQFPSALSFTHRLYQAGTSLPYPIDRLPGVRALHGEYTMIDDIELARGELRLAMEVRATPIFDDQGSITHALVVFQDITARRDAEHMLEDYNHRLEQDVQQRTLILEQEILERQQAEQALRQSEARNQAMLAAIPDLMFRVNRQGIYLAYMRSKSVVDVLPSDMDPTGQSFYDYMPADMAQRQMHYIQRALEMKALQVYEQELYIDGQWRWEEVRVMPCGPDEVLFLVRDVSDRKGYETELQQTNDRLEYLAQTDGLTQVANRRHFDHCLAQSWQKAEHTQHPLTLLLFDVDQFKRYNDFYGHQAGDHCLVQIAEAAQQMIRHPDDLVARYGGEEFAIILPNTGMRGAIRVAKRLRESVRALALPHAYSEVSSVVTVSIGMSICIPSSQSSPQDLITQADRALYMAKQQGRDRYILATTTTNG